MGTLYGKANAYCNFHVQSAPRLGLASGIAWETGSKVQELIAASAPRSTISPSSPAATMRPQPIAVALARRLSDHASTRNIVADTLGRGPAVDSKLRFFWHQRSKPLPRALLKPFRFASAIITPRKSQSFSANRGIFTWDGNYYALNLTERLGVRKTVVSSASASCINTAEE